MAPGPEHGQAHAALVRLLRDEGARVLATLVRTTGSLPLAEDAVQDAVIRALDRWPRDGVPPEPRAWLTLTARRRAIDLIRREAQRRPRELAAMALREPPEERPPDDEVLRDDLLRLLFICCHPALALEAQTALALRTLGGLSTEEVAASLLVTPATMARRLSRARQKIQAARIPDATPAAEELPARLRGVLSVVYLMFNEGYHASAGDGPLRGQLTSEAIRLVTLLRELLPDQVPVLGLAALLHLHDARRPARLDDAGEPVRLADQDRSRWDRAAVSRGLALLGLALRSSPAHPDPYVVQAAIAACHDLAPTWEATNWAAIVSWYDVLLTVLDTPVVRLARAIALGELQGAGAGLAALDGIEGLDHHLPFVAGRAELLARAGHLPQARAAYRAALELPTNRATRRRLQARLGELSLTPRWRTGAPRACRSGAGGRRYPAPMRTPAEWERHARTIMGWPCRAELWGETLAQARADHVAVANAIGAFEPVTMIANPGPQAAAARAACSEAVEVVELELDDSWLRDCGPIYTIADDGTRVAVHFRFNAWGEKFPPWDRDAAVGARIAELLGDSVREAALVLEGGSILTDGAGTLLTTEQCLLHPNRNPGMGREEIEAALREHLGVERFVWLGDGLVEDRDTDGHVDLIAAFTAPGHVLLQSVPSGNPNHDACVENAARLRAAGIAVSEMPLLPYGEVAGETVAAGYMNFYICNGAVIVPVAGLDPDMDEEALALIAAAYPGREVVGVPGLVIAYGGGGPHCITQQVPAVER